MAEALLRAALTKRGEGLGHIKVASCGLAADADAPASPNSRRAMSKIGLDLSAHRSRPVSQEVLDRSLVVFAMTARHVDALRERFGRLPDRVIVLRDVLPEGVSRNIPDPFGGDLREYEECRDSMVEAVPALLEFLRKHYAR